MIRFLHSGWCLFAACEPYFPLNSSTSLCSFCRSTRISLVRSSFSSAGGKISGPGPSIPFVLCFLGGGGGGDDKPPAGFRDALLRDLAIAGRGGARATNPVALMGAARADGRGCIECRLETGGGGARGGEGVFSSSAVAASEAEEAGGGRGRDCNLSASTTEEGWVLTGESCDGAGADERDDFPPERERGLGTGGFARVDGDLERVPGDGGGGDTVDSAVKLTVTMGGPTSASNVIGSDVDISPPGGIFGELLLPRICDGGC